ncbi:MAG: LysR family transcriptional regulator [Rhodobacter sp.]|nr:LysR family transcriptional regulator [Rhodobacter sp.]
MTLGTWDEIRTAFHVARLGTVSGAAEVLGVHHATVIRHIDALEERLGAKLFQRHARGYTPTEAGQDLLQVAQTTDDQFTQLAGRIRGRGEEVTGDLIITTLSGLAPLLVPSVIKFQNDHPDLVVRLLTGERLFRMEYGEAHVAIRAGSPPDQPDNVVQPFCRQSGAMYAAPAYIEEFGMPAGEDDLEGHRFICHDSETARSPFDRWIRANIPADQITFRATEQMVMQRAVREGAGIGFMPLWDARNYPDLVQVLPPREDWSAPLWLVTHVDLHRTMKVQAFTAFLKQEAKTWPVE